MTVLSEITRAVIESSDGITISALAELHPAVSRRVLQRHFKDLVDQKEIVAVGNGRGRKYRGRGEPGGDIAQNGSGNAIAFSADSQEVLDYVSQPLASRTPVGYPFDFLDEYQPNRTYYLSA